VGLMNQAPTYLLPVYYQVFPGASITS
jgi:hypothetical protein